MSEKSVHTRERAKNKIAVLYVLCFLWHIVLCELKQQAVTTTLTYFVFMLRINGFTFSAPISGAIKATTTYVAYTVE